MAGFLKPEGTYPHLNIRVADELRRFDDDGEFQFSDGEVEIEGDLNAGFEIIDLDELECEDEESFTFGEIMVMASFGNEPDYAMTYDDYDYRENEWLYQGQEDYVAPEESEDEDGLGRPTSGARYGRRLNWEDVDKKRDRTWQNRRSKGTQPAWQKHAGGGKRGRKSIRFAPLELPEPFRFEDHFGLEDTTVDIQAVHELYTEWKEEQSAYKYIQAVLAEFVEFDDQPLKRAA